MARITKRAVEAACPSSSEYILWDDKLTGVGLRVYPNGMKIYVIQYRIHGRARRIALGGPEKVRVGQESAPKNSSPRQHWVPTQRPSLGAM